MRILLAVLFLSSVAAGIGWLFWQTELQYTLPTPVPENYEIVPVQTVITLDNSLSSNREKPLFLHFFTTNCPCSRFNLDHFNYLKRQYSHAFDFYIVIPEGDDLDAAKRYFEAGTKIIRDQNRQLALQLGVYANPQAVLLTQNQELYFRGNYNKARYCIDPMSNFAQMAADSLLAQRPAPDFGPYSTIAYGCGIGS